MAEGEEDSGGSWLKTFFTSLPGVLTGVAALVTAIAALTGVFLTRGGDGGTREGGVRTTSAQNPRPQVEFLLPEPGRVAWKTPVFFRYSHVGKDSELWLIERADKYYPQPHCPGEQPTVERLPGEQSGSWRLTMEIGPKSARRGESFELLVLLTSKQASHLLSEQIRGWCTRAPWPGLSKLPEENTEVKATVTISR
jgi:hypothetical protein